MGNEHNRWGYHATQLQAGDPKRPVRHSYDDGPHRDRPVYTHICSGSIIRRSKPKRNRGGANRINRSGNKSPKPNQEFYSIQSTEHATPIRGRYETRWKPMQCECLVAQPNQGLFRCANKATQRLTISHLKVIRLLACEACGVRKLAWAEPHPVVVEPAE